MRQFFFPSIRRDWGNERFHTRYAIVDLAPDREPGKIASAGNLIFSHAAGVAFLLPLQIPFQAFAAATNQTLVFILQNISCVHAFVRQKPVRQRLCVLLDLPLRVRIRTQH